MKYYNNKTTCIFSMMPLTDHRFSSSSELTVDFEILSHLNSLLCPFREPDHHPQTGASLPVVPGPLDLWLVHIPRERLLRSGPGQPHGTFAH